MQEKEGRTQAKGILPQKRKLLLRYGGKIEEDKFG